MFCLNRESFMAPPRSTNPPSNTASAPVYSRAEGAVPWHEIDPHGALRGFFRIMELWNIDAREAQVLLGEPPKSTYYKMKKGTVARLDRDTIERISYVVGIYKALQLLFADRERADGWIRRPNRAFGGRSALEHALAGSVTDLADVRRYLDAVRGGL